MQRQKRIAAIHDISGAGKCSLTVALPIISAAGVECACIPTALLSTHTGEFVDYIIKDLTDTMLPIAKHWKSCGIELDGIYSGYLASPGQADILRKIIELLSAVETKVIIDPVMADHGEFYSNLDRAMADAFRGLCCMADLLTPNVTEAALLTGIEYKKPPHDGKYIKTLLDALLGLGAKCVAMTGIYSADGTVGNAVCKNGGGPVIETRPMQPGAFYGTDRKSTRLNSSH